MGIKREKYTASPTVELRCDVKFMDGSEGDFKGTFERITQDEVDLMTGQRAPLNDPEGEPRIWSNSEVVDRVLKGVSGISDGGQELPPEEQLAWVKATPECVTAAVSSFFKAMQRAKRAGKT